MKNKLLIITLISFGSLALQLSDQENALQLSDQENALTYILCLCSSLLAIVWCVYAAWYYPKMARLKKEHTALLKHLHSQEIKLLEMKQMQLLTSLRQELINFKNRKT